MAPTLTLVLKTVLVFFFGYWLISLLGNPDLLTQILAGMGIVGLAVSLAAQDAIKHFFGTLLLISEGPFKIGDRIIIDKYKGVVEVVGFRSTRIRTDKGTLLVLPNSVLAGGSVENLGRRNRNYARLTIPVLELPDNVTLEILTQRVQAICRNQMPAMKSPAKVDVVQAEGGKPPALRVRTWLPGWGGVQAENARAGLQDSVASVAVELGLVPLVDIPPWPATGMSSFASAA
jgi:MscS family membrane protein